MKEPSEADPWRTEYIVLKDKIKYKIKE